MRGISDQFKSFELTGKEDDAKMEKIVQNQFNVKLNTTTFSVHPDLESMISVKNQDWVNSLVASKAIPSLRRSVIKMYLDKLADNIGTKNEITKLELEEAMKKSLV